MVFAHFWLLGELHGLSKTERILLIFKLGPTLWSLLCFVMNRMSVTVETPKSINLGTVMLLIRHSDIKNLKDM